MKKMIVLSGLPSSGRTSYINSIKDDKTYVVETKAMRKELMGKFDVYDADNYLVDKSCDICLEKFKTYDTVILDSSTLRNQRRLQIYRRIAKFVDRVELVIIDCDPAVCIKRDSEKIDYLQRGNVHILESFRKMEDPNEAVTVAYDSITHVNGEHILDKEEA